MPEAETFMDAPTVVAKAICEDVAPLLVGLKLMEIGTLFPAASVKGSLIPLIVNSGLVVVADEMDNGALFAIRVAALATV